MNPRAVTEPVNRQIEDLYGPLLERSFGRLKGITIKQFQPAAGTIVVKKAPPETLTEGGLVLPDSVQQEPNIGVVVAINADADCPYSVGDVVFFRTGGYLMELAHGDKYLIMQYRGCIDDEVLGKFVPDVDAPDSA